MTGTARVDVVIAVHNDRRPVDRAVRSVLAEQAELGPAESINVIVVCHNIDVAAIAAKLGPELSSRVDLLAHTDGIRSAAGPFNAGIRAATGKYVSVMGSDDSVERKSISRWLAIAERNRSAAVIAPQRHAGGAKIRTPIMRVGRTRNLHPVKDRLSYRTAPLGLVATSEVERLGLVFSEGHQTGEDQIFSSRLWFGGGRIDFAARTGAYVVGDDAGDRVTFVRRPIDSELSFATDLVKDVWFQRLDDVEKRSIVTKLLRIHVFSLIGVRAAGGGWLADDREELARVTEVLLSAAPLAARPLSRADNLLLQAALDPSVPEAVLTDRMLARRRFGTAGAITPQDWRFAFHPESPLRILPAAALLP